MHGHSTRRAVRLGAALATALVAACSSVARADGYTLQLNPGYFGSTSTTTDETGHETRIESSGITQKYRLSLDQTVYPTLTLSAGGSLDWAMATSRSEGVTRDSDNKRWNGYGRLRGGSNFLSWALDYDHQEQESTSSGTGIPETSSALIRDTYGGSVSWRPSDLPSIDLRLTRSDAHDRARRSRDQTSDDALVSTRYEPVRNLDLRYSVRAARITDHLNDVRTSELGNSASATWSGAYLDGRGSVYASYSIGALESTVSARGRGGTVSTAQRPIAGLSVVEVFPALPTRVSLAPNSALVDGETSASAGLNLGYSGTSPTGERALRDLGAEFADAVTPVNVLYVYVDRTLPDEVAASFTWTVYESENNLDWTQVGGTLVGLFDPLLNRFEVSIERRSARYLKVVTRPLAPSVAIPVQFADIFVTELQLYLVVPAEEAVGRSSTLGGNLNASTKFRILDEAQGLALTYDLSTLFTHTSESSQVTYSVTNGLSASRRLARTVTTSGRVERNDTDVGQGHLSGNRWSAVLAYDPIPTLGGALLYSGQLNQTRDGSSTSQTFGAAARADLYQGIATSANVTYGIGRDVAGRHTRTTSVAASATITPNRYLSMAGSAGVSDSKQSGGGRPEQSDQRGLVEGSAALSPFRALAISGSVTRIFGRSIPGQTLISFGAGFSPFQGGDLQLRYAYQESIDTSGEQRTRTHGPAVRWNVRRGWFVDGGYSFLDSSAPAQDVSSRFYFANLSIALR